MPLIKNLKYIYEVRLSGQTLSNNFNVIKRQSVKLIAFSLTTAEQLNLINEW